MNRNVLSSLLLLVSWSVAAQNPTDPIDGPLLAEDNREPAAPALSSALGSADAPLRARAGLALGRIMKPAGVDPLLKLLGDPEAAVRQEAIFALGQLGWVAGASGGRELEVAAKLGPLLQSAEERIRVLAVEAIGKLAGEETPRRVTPMLKDGSASVRAEAALALFRWRLVGRVRAGSGPPPVYPDLAPESLAVLLSAAKDSDPTVRRNIAYYFARVKDVRGTDVLVELAKDADPSVRLFAVTGLGRSEDPRGAAAAAAATGDTDEKVRIAAVQSLISLKSGSLVPTTLAKDRSQHVRALVADAAASDEKSDGAVLVELWKDVSPGVRAAALKGLILRRQLPVLDLLSAALSEQSSVLREACVQAAAGLGGDGEAFLRRALGDPDELVRASALEALGNAEGVAGWAAIRTGLGASGIAERGTAVELLRNRKETEVLDAAAKAYAESQDPKWVEVRETLMDIVASRPGEASDGLLRKALTDGSPSVAAKARAALEGRGVKDLPAAVAEPLPVTPHRSLRFSKDPYVTLETTKGTMKIRCLATDAPIHVANFVGLVRAGFYDGLLWHRVVPNFVVQGGDPLGTGWGDAGWSLRAEINRARFERGALGMPRSQGFDTGSCQLFFTLVATPHLDGQYTVFGQVVEGVDVLDRIERGDRILKASASD